MSAEFIVFEQTNGEFVNFDVNDLDNDRKTSAEVLDSANLEHFINDSFYNEFHTTSKGKKFFRCVVSWINYHMPYDKKVRALEGDMKDGVRFCELLKSLKLQIDLPHHNPCSKQEKKENIYFILSFLAEQQDSESDPEMIEGIVEQIYSGDTLSIMSTTLNIIRHHVIDSISDPVLGRSGIQQLEYWAQEVVGMSGNICCSDFVTTSIENTDNLLKLSNHLMFELPSQFDCLTPDQKSAYLVDWFEKETGIPTLLDTSIRLENEDSMLTMWYHLLRYLWLAEFYKYSIVAVYKHMSHKLKNKIGVADSAVIPRDVILRAIETSYQHETTLNQLQENCKRLYNWVQTKIDVLKREITALDSTSSIESRSITLLTHLYKIMREERHKHSKMKLHCYKLHCDIQYKLKNSGLEHVEYHPTYNIFKIEDLWNRLAKLEHKLEQKIQGYFLYAENKNKLYIQWKQEISYVKQWRARWERYITLIGHSLPTLSSADVRKSVKVLKQKLINDFDDKDHTESARLLCSLLVEFSTEEPERREIVSTTNELCEEYQLFINDSRQFVEKMLYQQEATAKLEVMYNEMGDLLNKVDDQIHELYQFYSFRPPLCTLSACDKLSSCVKMTVKILFDISYEIDAVMSLEQDIEDVKASINAKNPKNFFTSLTPRYVLQRWDALLLETSHIEEYINRQKNACMKNQPSISDFTLTIESAVNYLGSKIMEINRVVTSEIGNYYELLKQRPNDSGRCQNHAAIKINGCNSIATLRTQLCESFNEIMTEVNIVAENLPNSALIDSAFDQILLLNECSSFCLATVDKVLLDFETCLDLIYEKEIDVSDFECYRKEFESCKGRDQLLPVFQNVVKLLATRGPKLSCVLVEQLRQAHMVDSSCNRVTLSTWLNFRHKDLSINLDDTEKQLQDCFHKFTGGKKFIKKSELLKYIDPELMPFLLRNLTEYFGTNYSEEEDPAYDHHRLISNLVGKGKRLVISLE